MRFKDFLKEGNPLSRLHTHINDNRGSIVISPERDGMNDGDRAAAHERMKAVFKAHGYGYRHNTGTYDEGNGVKREGGYHVFAKDNTATSQAELHMAAEQWSKDFNQQSYLRVHPDGKGGAHGIAHYVQDVPDGTKAGDLVNYGKIRYNQENRYGETQYDPGNPKHTVKRPAKHYTAPNPGPKFTAKDDAPADPPKGNFKW